MNVLQLQARLAEHGCFARAPDGAYDDATRAGILKAMADGPDYPIGPEDVAAAAAELALEPAIVWAFRDTETTASPFLGGRPTILFEPHRFSRATGHRFDASHPAISSHSWNRKLYPATQAGRWTQLLDAAALDVDAAFASASYGAFQILAENFARCEARDAWAFAWQEAQTEADQLHHFVLFVKSDPVLLAALRRGDWATAADRYNGTASAANRYADRLALNVARRRAVK